MLYFFHHYELPLILHQAQLQHLLLRSQTVPPAAPQEASPTPPDEATPAASSTISITHSSSPPSTVMQVTFRIPTLSSSPSETTVAADSHDLQRQSPDASFAGLESVEDPLPAGDSCEASPSSVNLQPPFSHNPLPAPSEVPEDPLSATASKSLHSLDATHVSEEFPEPSLSITAPTAVTSSNFSPVFSEALAASLSTKAPEATPPHASKENPDTSLSTIASEAPNTRHQTEAPPDPPDLRSNQDTRI